MTEPQPRAPGADAVPDAAGTPQAAARAYLAQVVRDPDAKPSDRLRAAEAILRAEPEAKGQGVAARDLDDATLLALARGEGGSPPLMGPAMGVTDAGPIHAHAGGPGKKEPHSPTAPRPNSAGGVPFSDEGDPFSGTPGPESRPPASNSAASGPISGRPVPISRRKPKRIEKELKKDDDVDPCS